MVIYNTLYSFKKYKFLHIIFKRFYIKILATLYNKLNLYLCKLLIFQISNSQGGW